MENVDGEKMRNNVRELNQMDPITRPMIFIN